MSNFYERALAANGDYGTLALDKALTDELLDILRRDAESEHNELRRKLEEVEAEKAQLLADYPDACDKFQAQLRATVAKLQAAETELQRERQKALGWKIEASDYRDLKRALKRIHDDSYTLVLASGTDYDFTVEHIIQAAAELDQKRAATTEEQAAPAAVELPGGKGPDYVTRSELVAALRRGAMSWLPEAGFKNVADELERHGPCKDRDHEHISRDRT